MPAPPPVPARSMPRVFRRSRWPEVQAVAAILRRETVGGMALVSAAIVAVIWANSPWSHLYTALRDTRIGPHALHLDLTLGAWAADGLLAVFFFVAGLELKRELRAGDLRDPAAAAVPVTAALTGVAVPALLFVGLARLLGGDAQVLRGWAVPTATDIAFALAVLALIGTHLPSAMRSFLLTLAVVDDLVAITIIAVFYTTSLAPLWLVAALVPLGIFAATVRRGRTTWWILAPAALATWALVHASGVHATVAGVILGLTVPIVRESRGRIEDAAGARRTDPRARVARTLEHRVHPFSAAFAVPLFAFFASGVDVRGGVGAVVTDPAAVAVAVALVVGKLVGVFGGTFVAARFTKAELQEDLSWSDVAGLALLAGIGFTVSLLVSELAYGEGSPHDHHVKAAVLAGSVIAAAAAAVVLRRRNATYRRIAEEESVDADADGIPDVFEDDESPDDQGHPDSQMAGQPHNR